MKSGTAKSRGDRADGPTLGERHAGLTRQEILDAALRLLEAGGTEPLTVRGVAGEAGIAERTVFRHFAGRDEMIDAIAAEAARRMDLPPPPGTLEELLTLPRRLYEAFEAHEDIVKAALRTEIYERLREGQARARWDAIRRIVDRHAPARPERERRIAAANIRYHLMAMAWHYYRAYFGFSPQDAIESAERAIGQALEGVGIRSVRAARRSAPR
jgi:AcrR family transcriptional regulator